MEGIKGRGEIKHVNVYIYLKMDCQRLREEGGEEGRRGRLREKRSLCSDQRGCFVQGNCSVLLL